MAPRPSISETITTLIQQPDFSNLPTSPLTLSSNDPDCTYPITSQDETTIDRAQINSLENVIKRKEFNDWQTSKSPSGFSPGSSWSWSQAKTPLSSAQITHLCKWTAIVWACMFGGFILIVLIFFGCGFIDDRRIKRRARRAKKNIEAWKVQRGKRALQLRNGMAGDGSGRVIGEKVELMYQPESKPSQGVVDIDMGQLEREVGIDGPASGAYGEKDEGEVLKRNSLFGSRPEAPRRVKDCLENTRKPAPAKTTVGERPASAWTSVVRSNRSSGNAAAAGGTAVTVLLGGC